MHEPYAAALAISGEMTAQRRRNERDAERAEDREREAALAAEGKLGPCPEHDQVPCHSGCCVSTETDQWVGASVVLPMLEAGLEAGSENNQYASPPSDLPPNLTNEWYRKYQEGRAARESALSF